MHRLVYSSLLSFAILCRMLSGARSSEYHVPLKGIPGMDLRLYLSQLGCDSLPWNSGPANSNSKNQRSKKSELYSFFVLPFFLMLYAVWLDSRIRCIMVMPSHKKWCHCKSKSQVVEQGWQGSWQQIDFITLREKEIETCQQDARGPQGKSHWNL